MKELTCPKCGSIFTVDEADYASIVNQVKNAEFKEEVEHRLSELHQQAIAEQKAEVLKAEQKLQNELSSQKLQLSKKEAEIAKRAEELAEMETEAKELAEAEVEVIEEKETEETETKEN